MAAQTKGPLYRYLDLNGDGTGAKDVALDHSGAQTPVFIKPAIGEVFVISRMLVAVIAVGQVAAAKYGDLVALTNGIEVQIERAGSLLHDLTDGEPVKTNADWGKLCYDVVSSGLGPGDTYMLVRWTFSRAGKPLFIDGDRDERLVVYQHDNLSTLGGHFFQIQGYCK